MQDTKNLKKKIKEYEELIEKSVSEGNKQQVNYWEFQLKEVIERISTRKKHKRKNEKLFWKSN
jgi:hypothetical protein